ncbi:MAG: LOG family protein [Gammaproteobacteria bacterium]|nr:LOG family protein [Gammaproteobacteria bacterium]
MNTIPVILVVIFIAAVGGCALQEYRCPTGDTLANVKYLGGYKGAENNLSVSDVTQDVFCAEQFRNSLKGVKGYITIMGGSKFSAPETNLNCTGEIKQCDEQNRIKQRNDVVYKNVQKFAKEWTEHYGEVYPIMTGAGPGIMEAGSRGAMEAIGLAKNNNNLHSIGYTTYYALFNKDNPRCGKGPRCADPSLVLQKYNGEIITDGLIFSSVAVRESMMIKHSAAILIAPGGTGTEWEISQILETIKSQQLNPIPVYVIGKKTDHWKTYEDRLTDMERRGVLSPGDIRFDQSECNGFSNLSAVQHQECAKANFEFIENPGNVIEKLRVYFKLPRRKEP